MAVTLRETLVLDGGLATELERRGADLRDPLWSARLLLDDPALIRRVHRDYFAAGADIATSASYQASLPALMRRGMSLQRASDLLRLSVRLAREARDEVGRAGTLVAASVGPYGAFLHDGSEYRGDYGLSVEALRDWHRPRLEILAACAPDLLACETIPCRAEAEALATLLGDWPRLPTWVSFSCRDETHLASGESLAAAVACVAGVANVIAVGVNCVPPGRVAGLLGTVAAHTTKPLVAYPNSGARWDAAAQTWTEDAAPFDWAAARVWQAAGARLIGGCCRTTPDTIRTIAAALRGVANHSGALVRRAAE